MANISPELYRRIREALLNSSFFHDPRTLRPLFADSRISIWRNSLPLVNSPSQQVQAIISFLANSTRSDTNENALVLLLQVLAEQLAPDDYLHHELNQLADELEQNLNPPTNKYVPPNTQLSILDYKNALALARKRGNRIEERNTLGELGTAYYRLGEIEQAITYSEQALVLAEQIGDMAKVSIYLDNLGKIHQSKNEITKAILYYEQALAIAKQISDEANIIAYLNNLGNIYHSQNESNKATIYYEQVLTISRQIHNHSGESAALNNLGLIYESLAKPEQAISYYQQAVVIAQQIGDRRGESTILNNLGLVYKALGKIDEAITYYQQALIITQQMGNRTDESTTLNNLGLVYKALGKTDEAITYYQRALVIAEEIDDRVRTGYTLNHLGNIYNDLGQLDQAKDYYEHALKIMEAMGMPEADKIKQVLKDLTSPQGKPFLQAARIFLKAAGFDPIDDHITTFLCQPTHKVWQKRFPQPVLVHILVDTPLNGSQVRQIMELAQKGSYPKIFVMINQAPTDDGWLQINTARAEKVWVIPIDDTIIFDGTETEQPNRVLEKHLKRFMGEGQDLYNVRDPVTDRLNFFGREMLAEEMMEQLMDGHPLALLGLRKMGKSSLLNYLLKYLAMPTALVDMQAGFEPTTIYPRILASWQKNLRVKFKELIWPVPDLSQAQDMASAFTAATQDLLTRLEDYMTSPQLGIVVDELDLIPRQADYRLNNYLTFGRTLRGLVQEEGRVSLLVAGLNPAFNRETNLLGEQNPFYQFFRELYLPTLSQVDCIQMVRNIGSQMEVTYEETALNLVAEASGGHPFLARQLCSLAYQELGRRGQITLSHIKEAMKRFIQEPQTATILDASGLWQDIVENDTLWSPAQLLENATILKILAQHEAQAKSELLQQATNLQACEYSLYELEKRAVLQTQPQALLSIQFGLFRNWIRRYKLGVIE